MIYPMNESYRWDPHEGIIGVVGVAPAATLDFFRRLTMLTPARKDWEHVRVLIDSNPKIPSRGRHLDLAEADPSPFIAMCIRDLCERGASVVAVPCNTAHVLYERYAIDFAAGVVPNMIDLAVAAISQATPEVPRRLAVLGSRLTVAHDLYGHRLRALGGGILEVHEWQDEVSALIELVKQGHDQGECAHRLRSVLQACQHAGADCFVIACTELSVVVRPEWVSVPVVDSSDTLARHCLQAVKPRVSILERAADAT
jgi:aspartate racemase